MSGGNTGPMTAQPIAIVGMSGIYPGAATLLSFWSNLVAGDAELRELPPDRVAEGPDPVRDGGTRLGAFLGPVQVDPARYGIPPINVPSIARAQLLFLEAADQCLSDAGYRDRDFVRDRTDVVCGHCFGFERTYDNALRIESARFTARAVEEIRGRASGMSAGAAARLAEELKRTFLSRYGAAAHDRIGEMASTIPSRISVANRLRGRCFTLESADATSFVALQTAVTNLRRREADLALVVVGQMLDGPLPFAALSHKGVLAAGASAPFAPGTDGYVLGEGVGALLLKRLDDALRDRDRVYCAIGGVDLRHASRSGTFRYPSDVATAAASLRGALDEAGWDAASLQHVECFGSGLPGEAEFEARVLEDALGGEAAGEARPTIGSVKGNIGHTFANAGIAAITKLALALGRRTLLPQARSSEAGALGRFEICRAARPWPENASGLPRRAAVSGYGLTGTACHVVLEEHVPGGVRRSSAARRSARSGAGEAVAVVGFGGRFADAPNATRFWENILEGHDALRPVPESVVDRGVYHDPTRLDPFTTYTVVGSKVLDVDPLPELHRLPPARLQRMDAAQRLALAVADEALSSLTSRGRGRRARSAVVLGSPLCLGAERSAALRLRYGELEAVLEATPAFAALAPADRESVRRALRANFRDAVPSFSSATLDGYLAGGVAAVVSNELGLDAVPVAVEAACASSLAAVDVAVGGLLERQWDWVLAGGVDLPVTPRDLVLCSALRLLSPTRIKPFDAAADGFSPGEGAAFFVLRRLEDALADGDRIRAVIRGVGASSDARSLVAPDEDGQALALRRAFERVDFAPSSVQYVEAHGTGTTVGDRVEARALAAVYGRAERSAPLALGSVKSMIGHAFAAAGAAGLLKTLLALEHGIIPPNVNLETLNPALGLDAIPAYVSTEPHPWPAPASGPRRAAVSSMGTGGINYHVLVEEAP